MNQVINLKQKKTLWITEVFSWLDHWTQKKKSM